MVDTVPFYSQTAILDTLIKAKNFTFSPEIVSLIAKKLRNNPDLYLYFFRNRPHPRWAIELLKHGYFTDAPELEKAKEGFLISRWEEQEYLISVAAEAPEVVIDHCQKLHGHGYYYGRAMIAVRQLSADLIESLVPLILSWLDNPNIAPSVSLEVLSLIQLLAKNKAEAAFQLFQKVTLPQSPPNSKKIGEYFLHSSAQSIFPFDDYGEKTISKTAAILSGIDIIKTISILEEQLCKALKIESDIKGTDFKKYTFWRSAIEESGQDSREEYKDLILEALRDTLEEAVKRDENPTSGLVASYLRSDYQILRRLGLHLLSCFPEEHRDYVASELLQPENMNDLEIHHEYFTLLNAGFHTLDRPQQEQLVNLILLGVSQNNLDNLSEHFEDESEEIRNKYLKDYSDRWIRDRLWMIKNYLEPEQKSLLNNLITDLGKPDHPDFTHWFDGGFYAVSDISPVTADFLREKSNEELVNYLKNWEPSKDRSLNKQETHGALGEELANVILSDVIRYSPIATALLSIHPAFAVTFIQARLPENCSFELALELRLDICQSLLADPVVRTSTQDSPGSWLAFRFATASMCEKIIANNEIEISKQQWGKIKDLLFLLAHDPDPDLELDRPNEVVFEEIDPLSTSINHVRSIALLSLINYAHRLEGQKKNKNPDHMPQLDLDIKDILNEKLRHQDEFSLAVHSIFGRELNVLYWLDKEWLQNHIDEIFPMTDDTESVAYYVAAWDSYVAVSNIFLEVFDLLRPKYERSVENTAKGLVTKTFNPVKGLSHHLLMGYQYDNYDINSPEGQNSLIVKFFMECRPGDRGEMTFALSQRTHKYKQEWPRAKELWNWRREVAANSNYSTDFKSEMAGFSHLLLAAPETESIDTLWPLLEGLLPYLNDDGWNRIWHNLQEYLAREVGRKPVEVISFYHLMHDQLKTPRSWYEDEARKILEAGATNGQSMAETLVIIDKICRKGNGQFLDIQEKILGPPNDN